MKIDISGVYLIEYKKIDKIKIKKLYLENDELRKFSQRIIMPSQKKLPYFDEISDSIFSTYPRFKVEELDSANYLFFLSKFYDLIEESDDEDSWLNSLDELFEKTNDFKPNAIIYKLTEIGEETRNECIYISSFKKNMLMEDKTILFRKKKKKDKDLGVSEISILDRTKIFVLPEEGFVCSIEKSEKGTGLKVYKAIELDKLFKIDALIDDYAEKKIRRFISDEENRKFKLTKEKADVYFKDILGNDKVNEVIEEVKSSENINLKKTYATFSGRSTKTIQKISLERLNGVIQELKLYAKTPQKKHYFTIDEIPRIDIKEKQIYVDEKSIKIFAAMLNNEIIQKLLDGTIEIPYYQDE